MEFSEVTYDEIDRFLKVARHKGAKVLSVLGKIAPQIHLIFDTEVGKEILSYDINRAEELLEKTYHGTATEKEKIILDYLQSERIPYVLDKLNNYLKTTEMVKSVVKKSNGKTL